MALLMGYIVSDKIHKVYLRHLYQLILIDDEVNQHGL